MESAVHEPPWPEPSWQDGLAVWLEPFLEVLRHKAQRRWAPVYIAGLLGPGARKSVEPMAVRVAPGDVQQLHHFVSASPWDPAPLEEVLVRQADALVGGPDAVLVIDDTALVKQGRASWRASIAASWARRRIARCWCR